MVRAHGHEGQFGVGDSSVAMLVEGFLRAVANGEVENIGRSLESKDRIKLMCATDDSRRNCVHHAARGGNAEMVRLLYDHGAEFEARDRFGRTPLHLACEHGQFPAVQSLLDCGCKPSVDDKTGRTPLHVAAACNAGREICGLLVARMPQLVSRTDIHGRTPLFYAVLNQNARAQGDVTALLIEQLAEIDACDSYGMVPLHYAAEEGHKNAVALLLRRRADANREDAVDGRTPLQLTKNESIRRMLKQAAGIGGSQGQQNLVEGGAEDAAGRQRTPSPARTPKTPRGYNVAGRGAAAAAVLQPKGKLQVSPAPQAPAALSCTPFHDLQARFVRIMERVQEGGLEQKEHLKRPHLFTGSWMTDVSSHQQLLGHTLKYVPGPEVCMRVFNLLRPPSSFPQSHGDERDIHAYYSENRTDARQAWGGVDPYLATVCEGEDDGLTYARRVELLRAIHEQRQQLESKDALVEELKRRSDRLEAELADTVDQATVQALRNRCAKTQQQLTEATEDLDRAQGQVRMLEGKVKVLTDQLAEKNDLNAQITADFAKVRQKLDAELKTKGEEAAWKLAVEQERDRSQLTAQQLEQQLGVVEAEKSKATSALDQLQSEVVRLKVLHKQQLDQASSEYQHLRVQKETTEAKLQQELHDERQASQGAFEDRLKLQHSMQQQTEAVRQAQAAKRQLEDMTREAAAVPQLQVQAANLRQEIEDLRKRHAAEMRKRETENQTKLKELEEDYHKMFTKFPLVGQMFFAPEAGVQQPPTGQPAAVSQQPSESRHPQKQPQVVAPQPSLGQPQGITRQQAGPQQTPVQPQTMAPDPTSDQPQAITRQQAGPRQPPVQPQSIAQNPSTEQPQSITRQEAGPQQPPVQPQGVAQGPGSDQPQAIKRQQAGPQQPPVQPEIAAPNISNQPQAITRQQGGPQHRPAQSPDLAPEAPGGQPQTIQRQHGGPQHPPTGPQKPAPESIGGQPQTIARQQAGPQQSVAQAQASEPPSDQPQSITRQQAGSQQPPPHPQTAAPDPGNGQPQSIARQQAGSQQPPPHPQTVASDPGNGQPQSIARQQAGPQQPPAQPPSQPRPATSELHAGQPQSIARQRAGQQQPPVQPQAVASEPVAGQLQTSLLKQAAPPAPSVSQPPVAAAGQLGKSPLPRTPVGLHVLMVGASGLQGSNEPGRAPCGQCSCRCEIEGRPDTAATAGPAPMDSSSAVTWNHKAELHSFAYNETLIFKVFAGSTDPFGVARLTVAGVDMQAGPNQRELPLEGCSEAKLVVRLSLPAGEESAVPKACAPTADGAHHPAAPLPQSTGPKSQAAVGASPLQSAPAGKAQAPPQGGPEVGATIGVAPTAPQAGLAVPPQGGPKIPPATGVPAAAAAPAGGPEPLAGRPKTSPVPGLAPTPGAPAGAAPVPKAGGPGLGSAPPAGAFVVGAPVPPPGGPKAPQAAGVVQSASTPGAGGKDPPAGGSKVPVGSGVVSEGVAGHASRAKPGEAKLQKGKPLDVRALTITVVSAKGLRDADWIGKSDPYCIVKVEGSEKMRTQIMDDTLNPVWNHRASIGEVAIGQPIVFEVHDKDAAVKQDDFLGCATLTLDTDFKLGIRELSLENSGVKDAKLTVEVVEEHSGTAAGSASTAKAASPAGTEPGALDAPEAATVGKGITSSK